MEPEINSPANFAFRFKQNEKKNRIARHEVVCILKSIYLTSDGNLLNMNRFGIAKSISRIAIKCECLLRKLRARRLVAGGSIHMQHASLVEEAADVCCEDCLYRG